MREQAPRRYLHSALCWALLASACGPASVDHTPSGNILDANTQDLEGGLGHWHAWYSTTVAPSTSAARNGNACLQIEVTAPDGWGVELDNWPGFPATPGGHRVELWGRSVSGNARELDVSVHWRNDSGDDLRRDVLQLPLGSSWQKLGQNLAAPSDTQRVWVELTGGDGKPGDVIQVDEVFVL